ncbi:pilus assembly protein PilM [Conservatibacter flavescens]|uniref:Competence protein ComA n=1 Tax=Conservatibacter flavescens TaxID=28161 RepID=A0A2M8S0Q4_9PAST|nr:pilus assembly protein PilM [Conservatibacter flavescens]PJG84730.1 hypothetical protein CVP05_09315 [Conservatibacter flavescens]
MLIPSRNKPHTLPIGIWLNGDTVEFVWFDQHETIQMCQIVPAQLSDYHAFIHHRLEQKTIDDQEIQYHFQFITAILPHRIWSKTLIIPHLLTDQECEQQCRYTLHHELPMPLEQVWYDYCYTPISHPTQASTSTNLTIFALTKDSAQAHMALFPGIDISVLDHAAHAILRAFYYLRPELQSDPEILWVYQDDNACLAFQNYPHELRIVQQESSNLNILLAKFRQRYIYEPDRCIIYRNLSESEELPEYFEELKTIFPVMALGCALWGRDNKAAQQAAREEAEKQRTSHKQIPYQYEMD